jgi:hypothetical protein
MLKELINMGVEWVEEGNEVDRHLDSKSRGISEKAVLALESALQAVFYQTQALVHVRTGRLRQSGRAESSIHEDVWEGEIIYGNELADYAWYEDRRGGTHEFMFPARVTPGIGVAFRVGVED